MPISKKQVLIMVAVLALGVLIGYFITPSAHQTTSTSPHQHVSKSADQTWTCAMHPQIRQDGPGQCPICGMDLIPVKASAAVSDAEIQMSEAAAKIADIQTVTVQQSSPTKEIYLPGRVKADERRVAAVTSRFPGRIERLYVNFTGQEVRKGERLASIYSPELIQAQKELLEAVRFRETNPSFYEAAVNKLKLWDLTDAQIQGMLENGKVQYNFDIYSTQSGTVISRNVSQGDYVNEGQSLFEVANLAKVWVLFDAYESDLSWIEKGDEVSFSVSSMPGQTFTSTVSFIDPVINPQTRVALVRAEVDNPHDRLKPDMFAQGIINSQLEDMEDALVIPKSSVLWTGKRAVVYVKNRDFEEPTFEFREVVLGPEAGDSYFVAEGLEAGEEVVANGVFKIDAAAQLQGKISMMNPKGGSGGTPMPGMTGLDAGPEEISTSEFVKGEVPDLSEQIPAAFKKQLKKVIEAYLELKEGLVKGDEDETAAYSTALFVALEKLDGNSLSGDAKAFWDEKRKFLFEHVKRCKEATTMDGKRENFIFLSEPLIKIVEAFGANQTLYVDFCPMAQDGKGAYWLSEVEEIRNPFMPEEMRTCGEVKDVINSK